MNGLVPDYIVSMKKYTKARRGSDYQKARRAIKDDGGRWAKLKAGAIRAADDANIERRTVAGESRLSFGAYVEMRDAGRSAP